eukprot:gene5477-7582_t
MENNSESSPISFSQIVDVIPFAKSFYFQFEIDYDPAAVFLFMESLNYSLPIISVVLYLLFCYFGKQIMENRPPFLLTNALAVWNLFLSIFSTYGAIRTVPHLLVRMAT